MDLGDAGQRADILRILLRFDQELIQNLILPVGPLSLALRGLVELAHAIMQRFDVDLKIFTNTRLFPREGVKFTMDDYTYERVLVLTGLAL